MGYQKIVVPTDGDKITVNADLSLNVPNHPIIPFIEGDGIGVDITPVMKKRLLMLQYSKLTVVSDQSSGWKCIAVRKQIKSTVPICQKKPLMHYVNLLCRSKVL